MKQDDRLGQEMEQWRAKYYDGLAQLEKKEKEWHRAEQVLRQCISRLTLAADSSDKALTAQLDRLRDAIRKDRGTAELEALIQSLSEQLVRLDQERRSRVRPPSPHELLRQLADGINFPRGIGHKAKAYSKALAAQGGEADYQVQMKELIALIGEALDWVAAQGEAAAPAGGKGVLSRLFGRGEQPAEQTPVQEAAEVPDALAPAKRLLGQLVTALVLPAGGELSGRIVAARREDELRRLVGELAALQSAQPAGAAPDAGLSPQEVLLQLLERLSVPQELQVRVEAINATLAGRLDTEELERVLGSIADLITTMRSRVQGEKAEIEQFLQQLTESLRELDVSLTSTVSVHQETVQNGRVLGEQVQVQMEGIEDSVRRAQNLEHLKQAVQERVATIRRHMDVFRRTEDERIEQAEQEVAKLKHRLYELEGEAEGLRTRIQKERNQALIDPLTEIPNRLAYNERIEQEYTRWKRYRAPLVFTVWDVDHFKRINDTYGHQAGDKVLKVVAKVLSSQIREADFLARYGGEEFVILLPETEMEQAVKVTEKIRLAIEQCEFHYRGERVQITISCGLSAFAADDEPDNVFARADAALYRAKAEGRNRCRVSAE